MNSKNTIRTYYTAVKQFLTINNIDIEQIKLMTPAEINKLIDATVNLSSYSISSKLLKLSAIRSYIQNETGITLPQSKISRILAKKKLKCSNKEDISTDEIHKILEYFKKCYTDAAGKSTALRNYLIIRLLIFTGQRIGDILKLKIKNVKKPWLFFKQEKTGSEILIDNPIIPELALYIALTHLNDNDYLFASGLLRNHLSYNQAYNIIVKNCLKITGKNITPHCFRKYFITKLCLNGNSFQEIMSASGHTDPRMILYYAGNKPQIKNLKDQLLY